MSATQTADYRFTHLYRGFTVVKEKALHLGKSRMHENFNEISSQIHTVFFLSGLFCLSSSWRVPGKRVTPAPRGYASTNQDAALRSTKKPDLEPFKALHTAPSATQGTEIKV